MEKVIQMNLRTKMDDLQGSVPGKIYYLIRNSKPVYFFTGVSVAIIYITIYIVVLLPLSFINIIKANLKGEYLDKDCYSRIDNVARGDEFSRKRLFR